MKNFKLINESKHIIIILFFMFLIGVIIGSFVAKFLTDEQGLKLTDYIINNIYSAGKYDTQNVSNSQRLLSYILNDFQVFLAISVFSLTILAIPFCLILTMYKGFIIGFTSAFLIKMTSTKGLLFILIAVLPQNTLRIILLIFCNVFVIKYALQKKHFSLENKKKNAYKLVSIIFFVFLLNLGVNLIEVYVTPQLIKIFSIYLT